MKMKYYKLLTVLSFALLTQANCCVGYGDDYVMYAKNSQGIPQYIYLTTIKTEDFKTHAVGKGWKYIRSFQIKEDGKVEYLTFLGNGYPMEYYFTDDSVIVFQYYQDKNVRWRDKYSYDETKNQINVPSLEYMQVNRLDSLNLEIVEAVGVMGFSVNTYELMMPYELNARMLGFDEIER